MTYTERTYVFVLARHVVGDLHAVEARAFGHPVLTGSWRLGMDVYRLRHFRIRLAREAPLRVVELVAVVVRGQDVHHNEVLAVFVQTADLHLEGRKHAPEMIDALRGTVGWAPKKAQINQ